MDQIDLSDEEIVFLWQRGVAVYLKLETEEESKKHTREQIKTIVEKNIRRTLHHEPRTCETCSPQSADVETVREFIEYISESFLHYSVVRQRKADALAALDRIAGKVPN